MKLKTRGKSLDHIPFRAMKIDHTYQREVSAPKVRALKKDFNEEGLGTLHVAARDDAYYLIDGQHRWHAAMELGHGDMKVACVVYRGISIEQEAELFLLLNDSKNMSALDRFKAGLVAGDEECLSIRDTLDHYGLRIASGGADGAVGCVQRIKSLHKADPKKLDELCLVLTEAWGTRAAAFDGVVVAGVGKVLTRYNGELDHASLISRLSKFRGGPTSLVGDARGLAEYSRATVAHACAEVVVNTYNRGRRSKQLPPL